MPLTAFLNSASIFPTDSPNSGKRFGPKINSAPRTMTIKPGAPISRKIPSFFSFPFSLNYPFTNSDTNLIQKD